MGLITDGSVIGRGVVSLGDGKLVGTVSALAVDPGEMSVSHYVVASETTGAELVLPVSKTLSVGDTFLTIEWRVDFLPADGFEAKGILGTRFDLPGLPAYNRAGNALAKIASFEYVTTTGEITEMVLEDETKFGRDQFIFISPEFAFFNSGEETDADIRGTVSEPEPVVEKEPAAAKPAPAQPVVEKEEPEPEPAKEEAAPAEEPEAEEAAEKPAENAPSPEDAELMKFLVGKKLSEACASEDGSFKAEAGDVLTQEQVDAAYAAGALLVLAMSAE